MGLYETETRSYPSTLTKKSICLHQSIYTYTCQSAVYIQYTVPRCPKHITYMSINSGIQTFREPFAGLSQSFATAAKTHIHICRCHSDTKSLAWVLERLPHNMNMSYYIHNQQLITIKGYPFCVIKHGWDVCSWATRSMWKFRLQRIGPTISYSSCFLTKEKNDPPSQIDLNPTKTQSSPKVDGGFADLETSMIIKGGFFGCFLGYVTLLKVDVHVFFFSGYPLVYK